MNEILQHITTTFQNHTTVQSVVLAGSKQNVFNDTDSDYDIYVYSHSNIPIQLRESLAALHSNTYEINNQFWEDGDEWIISGHPNIDIMYRNCTFPQSNIDRVFHNHNACTGYTTCILYNIQHSKILYDKDYWFSSLQQQLDKPYPDELVRAIIRKNYPILSKNISSYMKQIEKSIKRNDMVNLNNRITAFLNSYFDIIFAINKQFHPGEKRLLAFAKHYCTQLPENFEKNLLNLLSINDNPLKQLEAIYKNLQNLLTKLNYAP